VITSLLFSKLQAVRQMVATRERDILQAVLGFIDLAAHKCERPSSENASECLSALASFSESARQAIFSHGNLLGVAMFAVYMPPTATMSKIYMIHTF